MMIEPFPETLFGHRPHRVFPMLVTYGSKSIDGVEITLYRGDADHNAVCSVYWREGGGLRAHAASMAEAVASMRAMLRSKSAFMARNL